MEKLSADMESNCEYACINKQSGHKGNGGPPALCLGEVLTNSELKNLQYYEILYNWLVRAILNTVMKLLVQQVLWNSWKT